MGPSRGVPSQGRATVTGFGRLGYQRSLTGGVWKNRCGFDVTAYVQTRPVTGTRAPVAAVAASLARNSITAARSAGFTQMAGSVLGISARLAGVSRMDGSTALTVTLSPFSSSASD